MALPSLPSAPAAPSLPKVPSAPAPKLPSVKPTKINPATGAGVPGGFTASSVKLPSTEAANANSNLAAIAAKQAQLARLMQGGIPIPGLAAAQRKLKALQSKYMNKLKAALKAPNFKSKSKFPSPPKPPSTPDFGSLGIPDAPSAPSLPKVPSVPSAPSVPNLPKV